MRGIVSNIVICAFSQILWIAWLDVAASAATVNTPPPGTRVAFSACPVRTVENCWVAAHAGVTYSLVGGKPHIPHLGVSVMGVISNKVVSFCPGVKLRPIQVSTTRQRCE